MPIYEYECTACKVRFERSQRFSDPPVTECPDCGSAVRRVFFPAGIVFKGSGWYVTDSRKPAAAESGAAAGTASNGSAGGESKPDGAPSGEAKKDGAPAKGESAPTASSSKDAKSSPSSASSSPSSGSPPSSSSAKAS